MANTGPLKGFLAGALGGTLALDLFKQASLASNMLHAQAAPGGTIA